MGFSWQSNLYTRYPEFTSYNKPSPPFITGKVSQFSYNTYKNEVTDYINDYETYIKKCNNDIEQIKENAKKAQIDVEEEIEEFNNWVSLH